MKRKCVECCSTKELHNHHVIPKSLGGTYTVVICGICHSKLHQLKNTHYLRHSELIRLGQQKAKKNGVILGAKKQFNYRKISNHLKAGLSFRQICKELNCSIGTVSKVANSFKWFKTKKVISLKNKLNEALK